MRESRENLAAGLCGVRRLAGQQPGRARRLHRGPQPPRQRILLRDRRSHEHSGDADLEIIRVGAPAARHRQDRRHGQHLAQSPASSPARRSRCSSSTPPSAAGFWKACAASRPISPSSSCTTKIGTAPAIRCSLRDVKMPLCARIVHVADAYDAMTSARPYRSALSHEDAMRRTEALRGRAIRPGGRAGADQSRPSGRIIQSRAGRRAGLRLRFRLQRQRSARRRNCAGEKIG